MLSILGLSNGRFAFYRIIEMAIAPAFLKMLVLFGFNIICNGRNCRDNRKYWQAKI